MSNGEETMNYQSFIEKFRKDNPEEIKRAEEARLQAEKAKQEKQQDQKKDAI